MKTSKPLAKVVNPTGWQLYAHFYTKVDYGICNYTQLEVFQNIMLYCMYIVLYTIYKFSELGFKPSQTDNNHSLIQCQDLR